MSVGSGDYPCLYNGVITLPKTNKYNAGEGLCLANDTFNLKPATNNKIGGIISVSMDSSITTPTIDNGQIKLPTIGGGGNNFSDWFCVTGNTVTLNEAKLTQVANELAGGVSSQITSVTDTTTIATYNNKGTNGTIKATVTTTSGCSGSLTVTS